jgi:hypothetical protein
MGKGNAAVAQRDLRGRVRRVGVFQYGTGRLHEWFNNSSGHKYNTIFFIYEAVEHNVLIMSAIKKVLSAF